MNVIEMAFSRNGPIVIHTNSPKQIVQEYQFCAGNYNLSSASIDQVMIKKKKNQTPPLKYKPVGLRSLFAKRKNNMKCNLSNQILLTLQLSQRITEKNSSQSAVYSDQTQKTIIHMIELNNLNSLFLFHLGEVGF